MGAANSSSSRQRALCVMGRLPRAGQVKTRLSPYWTPKEAALLYEAFLRDVFAVADAAARELDFHRVFSCALESENEFDLASNLMPGDWTIVEQQGRDLGARIAFSRAAAVAEHVVVLGSDSPSMSPGRILKAFALLDSPKIDLVMGPVEDGGYDLIGFDGSCPGILSDIPWSTATVAETTRVRAKERGYNLAELKVSFDVDRPEDLDRVLVEAGGNSSIAVHTQRIFAELSALRKANA
jgi:rSAM/selenodomain-associated transferase 1